MSHADGFSGSPRNFHTSSARQKASCTTSSASARLWTPKMRQRGDYASRFAPKQMIAGIFHMLIFMTGRTSTAPSTSKIGQPLESSTACSRSLASISV
jgi:hypothetical protein